MFNAKLFVVAVIVTQGAIAADRNLLPNGDFSQPSQLAGWTCTSATWNSDDAAASAASGSLALQEFFNSPGQCVSSCFAVRPGAGYSLGGQSRVLLGNPVITFTCAQGFDELCNSETYDIHGPAMATAVGWNSQPAVSGGTLLGLSVKCKVTLGSADLGSVSGHFDNLFFATEDLFFDGFEAP